MLIAKRWLGTNYMRMRLCHVSTLFIAPFVPSRAASAGEAAGDAAGEGAVKWFRSYPALDTAMLEYVVSYYL